MRAAVAVGALLAMGAVTNRAAAGPSYPKNYFTYAPSCWTCHTQAQPTADGLNDFGVAWKSSSCHVQYWGSSACDTLRGQDSDHDGGLNGDELAWNTNPGVKGDIDECKRNLDQCTVNALCVDGGPLANDYTCSCPSTGFTARGDGHAVVCTDLDECKSATCSAHSSCENQVGSYLCRCADGYFGDGKVADGCNAGDACAKQPCAPISQCSQQGITTSCSACPPGYTGNGKACADIDECATNHGDCDPQTTCTNTPGGRTCGPCPAGMSGDGVVGCQPAGCDAGVCGAHAACEQVSGAPNCVCSQGFEGDDCTDIDECTDDPCGSASCTNLPGTFSCACGSTAMAPPASTSVGEQRSDGPPPPPTGLAVLVALLLSLAVKLLRSALAQRRAAAGYACVAALLVAVACGSTSSPPDQSIGDAGSPASDGGVSAAGRHSGFAGEEPADGGRGEPAAGGIANVGGSGEQPAVGCQRSCECGAGEWCNPASKACESRQADPPISFDDVRAMLIDRSCVACHDTKGAGAVDSLSNGRLALFTGDVDDIYRNVVAGGVGCAEGAQRTCVDEPATSLLATKTLRTPTTHGQPSITFLSWADPDLQLLLKWMASGAPRRKPAPYCGNHIVEDGENCDEGPNPAPGCPYGVASCQVCNHDCQTQPGVGGVCGDGKVDEGYETCDDGNTTVEEIGPHGGVTCGEACTQVAGKPCGGLGMSCCASSTACGADMLCQSGQCQASCGIQGLKCCSHSVAATHSDGCPDGLVCQPPGPGYGANTCQSCGFRRPWTLKTQMTGTMTMDPGCADPTVTNYTAPIVVGFRSDGYCDVAIDGRSVTMHNEYTNDAGYCRKYGAFGAFGEYNSGDIAMARALCPAGWADQLLNSSDSGRIMYVTVEVGAGATPAGPAFYKVTCDMDLSGCNDIKSTLTTAGPLLCY